MVVVVVTMAVVGVLILSRRLGVKSVVVPVLELEVVVLGLLVLLLLLPPGPGRAFRLACPRHLVPGRRRQ